MCFFFASTSLVNRAYINTKFYVIFLKINFCGYFNSKTLLATALIARFANRVQIAITLTSVFLAQPVCVNTFVTFDRRSLPKLVERAKFTDARQHRLGLQGRDHRLRPSQHAAADRQTAGSDSAAEPRWDKQASLIDRDPLLQRGGAADPRRAAW